MFISIYLAATRFILASLVIGSVNSSLALQVGVLIESAVLNSSIIQAFQEPSRTEITEKEKELESLIEQLQKSREEFDKNQTIMDSKIKAQQEKALVALSKQFQTKMVDLEKKRHDMNQQTDAVVREACANIAKQNKLDIIFSGKTGGALYSDVKLDVTQQVLTVLPNILNNTPSRISKNN